MTRPIKIADDLYKRLKARAQAEGLTLQDALVELIATPHEGLNRLEGELAVSRQRMESGETSRQALKEQIEKLSKRIDQLIELRNKDIATFNSWVETWESVPTLVSDFINLEDKVTSLGRLSHRHTWQVVEEE